MLEFGSRRSSDSLCPLSAWFWAAISAGVGGCFVRISAVPASRLLIAPGPTLGGTPVVTVAGSVLVSESFTTIVFVVVNVVMVVVSVATLRLMSYVDQPNTIGAMLT